MKPRALRTLTGYDVIKFIGHRRLRSLGIQFRTVFHLNVCKGRAARPVPLAAAFVNGRVGAFGFTRSAVYALVRNPYGHNEAKSAYFKDVRLKQSQKYSDIYIPQKHTFRQIVLQPRITREEATGAFARLGQWMTQLPDQEKAELFRRATDNNAWFTRDSLEQAWAGIAYMLDRNKLEALIQPYPHPAQARTTGVIMAGNIPLVGFHDAMCVLLCGHTLWMKPSARDSVLIRALTDRLKTENPLFASSVFEVERLNGVEAAIATGSDNSARSFEYYFRNIPHLIRKNRSSCAVLYGDENQDDLLALGNDVFSYFGLGCRNVSLLLVPAEYSFPALLQAWGAFSSVGLHHKYANNLDYQKAILLVNREPFLDGGHVLLRESDQLTSPISVVHYQYYHSPDHLNEIIRAKENSIQAIVSKNGKYANSKSFGCAQRPEPSDFADGVDTLAFLAGI